VSGFVFGASAAFGKLRGRAVAAAAAGILALVSLLSWAARHFEVDDAVDHVLGGAVFGVVLPLVAYAAIGRVCGELRLEEAVRPISRHGGDRRAAVLGLVVATAFRVASLGVALAALAVLFARGRFDGPALIDAFTSAWIGALGGAVYVVWFALGALFLKGGKGRAVALGVDWIFGTATSAVALPWPRAHLRSLLGGELVAGLPEWQSTVALYALGAVYLSLVSLRVAR
jgi:hypothetical protein